MPRDAESRKTFYLQSVLFCVRNKLIWLLRGEGKKVMINSAAARSRVRAPTRSYQSHTAVHHCGDQVAFQENGPTYVDPSSHRIQTVSGRYAATPRSKSIATFLAFDRPTKSYLSNANAWPVDHYRSRNAVRSEQDRRQGKQRRQSIRPHVTIH